MYIQMHIQYLLICYKYICMYLCYIIQDIPTFFRITIPTYSMSKNKRKIIQKRSVTNSFVQKLQQKYEITMDQFLFDIVQEQIDYFFNFLLIFFFISVIVAQIFSIHFLHVSIFVWQIFSFHVSNNNNIPWYCYMETSRDTLYIQGVWLYVANIPNVDSSHIQLDTSYIHTYNG